MGNVGIFHPVVVLVFWTLVMAVLIPLSRAHGGADGARAVGAPGAASPPVNVPNRVFMNLLEAPVLFYVGCLVLFVTGGASYATIAIAWVYVAARIVHSLIHLTYNRPAHRGIAFAIGNVVLAVLWIVIAVQVFQPGPV